MKTYALSLPQLSLIAATRGIGGAGLGLLIASRIPPKRRRMMGWTLVAAGALSTIPLVVGIMRKKSKSALSQASAREPESVDTAI